MSLTRGVIKPNIIKSKWNPRHHIHNDRQVRLRLRLVANILGTQPLIPHLPVVYHRLPTWITATLPVQLEPLIPRILHIINLLPQIRCRPRQQALRIIRPPELYLRLGLIKIHIIMPVKATAALRVLSQYHLCHTSTAIRRHTPWDPHHISQAQDLTTPISCLLIR